MDEHNEGSSEEDEEYEDRGRGLEFIFGNVYNSGDLDADYLDEDAKEHLSALASSLPDIILLANSEGTKSDPAEQDYDENAEDAIDYEDNNEEYDGPEVTEEDHLQPKREFFSSAASSGSLYAKASVFDDEDYDEDEEQEEKRMPCEEAFDSEESESVVLTDDKATILGNEDQMGTNEKSATSLPTLYVEDGMVILQFSEIFSVHEPPQKRNKRENRHITHRDRYKSMGLIEDDEELLLKSHGRIDTHVKQADLSQLDVPLPTRVDLQLVKAGTVGGITPESREFTKLGRDSCTMGELLKQDFNDDNSSLCQSQLSTEVFPLDQHEWEHRILWENSPEASCNSGESFESGHESESMLVQGTKLETEKESINVVNSREQAQADNNMLVPFLSVPWSLLAQEVPTLLLSPLTKVDLIHNSVGHNPRGMRIILVKMTMLEGRI